MPPPPEDVVEGDGLRLSASPLKRWNAAASSSRLSVDARVLARAPERVPPGVLAERQRHREAELLRIHDLVGRRVLEHPVLVDAGLVRERARADDRLVALDARSP